MEYGVLGPLEISEDGRSVEVKGARQRALLATLLLNRNRTVSIESLVDAVWEDKPPETAVKAVQVHVSRLRTLLGKDRLLTRAPGYMLLVAEDELDAERFDKLREQGRFAEALALWRGP